MDARDDRGVVLVARFLMVSVICGWCSKFASAVPHARVLLA
eukprot:CAMPEP_0118934054 /NCGR_PEP_ID=MMETSP1169-20130426/13483_1 /TAXON_ID=36882 /ORGANISM="Pyramimonas obovata, Strain CCMP722" /LENGTH=40 /DNA_ID= /DNA_START= /DNA_END= /DNA_ORIENTATION=